MCLNNTLIEKEAIEVRLQENETQMKSLTDELNKISEELMMAKSNLGSVLNTIFEHGGADLLERCEKIIIRSDRESETG